MEIPGPKKTIPGYDKDGNAYPPPPVKNRDLGACCGCWDSLYFFRKKYRVQSQTAFSAFGVKSTTNPQNGQISAVVLTIRLFFVSVRPVEVFEWTADGIVERGFGFQNITLFENASHFIKR